MNELPESGVMAELSAKLDVLEIALMSALSLQTKQQREAFLQAFDREIAARESVNRNTGDPMTWAERLAPHAKKLRAKIPK